MLTILIAIGLAQLIATIFVLVTLANHILPTQAELDEFMSTHYPRLHEEMTNRD
jgi:hypothetical protein